jgi:hypothetical protein
MAVHLFFNPDLVGQLAACGITARRPPTAATSGFVLEGRRTPPRARETVTNVIAVHGHVRITGERELPAQRPRPAIAELPAVSITRRVTEAPTTASLQLPPGPQTAIELVEECARLRRDNQRLTGEVDRLRSEVMRLSGGPRQEPPQNPDDYSALRFAMLELD